MAECIHLLTGPSLTMPSDMLSMVETDNAVFQEELAAYDAKQEAARRPRKLVK